MQSDCGLLIHVQGDVTLAKYHHGLHTLSDTCSITDTREFAAL